MTLLEIGEIMRAHGLRGEVVVSLVTTRDDRLAPGSELVLRGKSGRGDDRLYRIVASRPFQHRYLVTFEGVDSREAAEALRGVTLLAEPNDDGGEELYVHELVGKILRDQHGAEHGRVTSLEANPASDLLVLEGGGLVPLRFVVSVEGESILAEIPDGLLE